jgi:cephalosporin hydroxylase
MTNIHTSFTKYPGIGKLKYTSFYQRHFNNLKPKILLEIGVLKGASLRAWQDIFPKCKVIGIDIEPLCKEKNPDLNIYIGDQKDTEFLSMVINEIGVPDIIIDDGGHKRSQQIESLRFLFPKLGTNGLYIIEDLQTNYLPQWNDQEYSTIDYLKSLIDPLDHSSDMKYTSFTFEPNQGQSICMLRK